MSGEPRRVGDTLRRPVGPNSDLVEQVLRRLGAAGASWAPRPLGVHDGELVVSWIDGEPASAGADVDLQALARMVRELHDLTRELVAGAECVIHDDLQPRNVLTRRGRSVGLIDWEQARPGRPVEDVANLCWSFVEPAPGSDPAEIGRAWRAIVDGYGLSGGDEVVPTARRRMARCIEDIEHQAAAGSARHRVLADRGDHLAIRAMLAWTDEHADALERCLTDP